MKNENKKASESSNLKSIDDVSKKYKSKGDLSTEVDNLRKVVGAQELENKRLIEQLEDKDEEIAHLKDLLSSSGSLKPINDEELIAIMQLQKLKDIAQQRALTLEESRKFEIFSKIKQNSEKAKPIDANYKKLPNDLNKKNLLQIAQGNISKKDDK